MKKFIIGLSLLLCCVWSAEARLEITKGQKQLPSIVINLAPSGVEEKISKLVVKDLEVSGNFKASTQQKEVEKKPSYLAYQAQKTDLLVYIEKIKDKIVLSLFDINAKKRVLQKDYHLENPQKYPFVAHKMANAINEYLQAPSIEWMNRLVVFAKLVASSKSEIVIADYTLTYQQTIINDGLNIFPKWADKEQSSIYFTKYLDRPTIIKYDLKTKRAEKILSSQGIAIVSDVSNDYKKLLLSLSPIAQADIYLYDLEAKVTKRLTKNPGIDVGASFVENQKKIIFVSDRLGYPNIFMMNEDGSGVKQAVFHGKNNSSATSNGEYVVYSSRDQRSEFGARVFNLYLISLNGSDIRKLTLNGENQLPRFSQDGENVMFLKNTGSQSALGIVRLRYNKTNLFPIAKMKIQSFDW